MAHLYKQGTSIYKNGSNIFRIGDKYTYTGTPVTTTTTSMRRIFWEPVNNRIYVPNATAGTVQVIDGVTLTTVATITGVSDASAVAVDIAKNRMYITDGSGTLYQYNPTTYAFIANLGSIGGGNGFSIDPVNNRAIGVTYGNPGTAFVIDTSTNTLVTSFAATTCYAVAHDPVLPQYYLIDGSGYCRVYDKATNGLLTSVYWGTYLIANIAFDPISQNNRFYAIQRDGGIKIINNTTLGIIGDVLGNGITGVTSWGIACDPTAANMRMVAPNNIAGKLQVITQSAL
ncbi:hypothetical protein HQ865_01150 [Mucilaginibacter mali]|uniref:Uncharacterized protein n=1 Tax=Mucilaginibacter mali TaxID=2740462 RepID=A0A7D4UKI9_9SPHI|nr:hypothetical protein [Mucilaginibacter mali]QKJ28421.1 hypothetical protein HQ865_01150 [Mucilaginibacter mali]